MSGNLESSDDYLHVNPNDYYEQNANLHRCLLEIQAGDLKSVSTLANIVESELTSTFTDSASANEALRLLESILSFLSDFVLAEEVTDALSFEIPKAIAGFAGVSDECATLVDRILDKVSEKCCPRDMLSIICEALGLTNQSESPSKYATHLIKSLAKVIRCTQRRPFEQFAATIPIVLNVLKYLTWAVNDANDEFFDLFQKAISIADSIQATREELDAKLNESIGSLLSLYAMEVMALISVCMGSNISCSPLVNHISSILLLCDCSYLGLITGSDVEKHSGITEKVEEDSLNDCFSDVKLGAALIVIFLEANEEKTLETVKEELGCDRALRWKALTMVRLALTSERISWKLKQHAIELLLCITIASSAPQQLSDNSLHLLNVFPALQSLTIMIMRAPLKDLRTNTFQLLKRVVADVPSSMRLQSLQLLIRKSESPQMNALLIDIARGELHKEMNEGGEAPLLWTEDVLAMVEIVLKPSEGGPPKLPDDGEGVLAALNLFRFVLMTESARKSNHTGVLSKEKLEKAYWQWLLPLRALLCRMRMDNDNADDALCCINPLEMVLYHCLQLVEETQKVLL